LNILSLFFAGKGAALPFIDGAIGLLTGPIGKTWVVLAKMVMG
jgi:hypothetical protein